MLAEVNRFRRITSYNVCYTKLLREKIVLVDPAQVSGRIKPVGREHFAVPPLVEAAHQRAAAPSNKFEFKLVDPAGVNVWRYEDPAFVV